MAVIDFAVRIHRDTDRFVADVDSPYGYATGGLQLPAPAPDGEGRIERFERLFYAWLHHPGDPKLLAAVQADQLALGRDLYAALFHGELELKLENTRAHVMTKRDAGDLSMLRVRLAFEPDREDVSPVAAFPWELLHSPHRRDFLARLPESSVVRYLETRDLRGRLPVVNERIRVLLVDSNPAGHRKLDGAGERQNIRAVLEKSARIQVEECENIELGALARRLREGRFHVLHFIGHGAFDAKTGEGAVLFAAADGTAHPVSGIALAQVLESADSLRVVVLASCWSGAMPRGPARDAYRSVAPALLMNGIGAVVATQFPITDAAAIAFNTAFYEQLASGSGLDAAVYAGRRGILEQTPGSPEWATPVLFLHDESAHPFAISMGPLRLGIRTGIRDRDSEDYAAHMEGEVEQFLSLDEYFEGRFERDPSLWGDTIAPRLRKFLVRAAAEGRPLQLSIAAHLSVAFAAGYYLEPKAGRQISLRQRTDGGTTEWSASDPAPADGQYWTYAESERRGTGMDVVLGLSVTAVVDRHIEAYVARAGLDIGRMLFASLPDPEQRAVRNGAHAVRLARELTNKLQRWRTDGELAGTLHLFAAAPGGLLFFLGQNARHLGAVQLYEYDFDGRGVGAYRPSIRLPSATHSV